MLSEKNALDEARAGLLADIAREGRIHGRLQDFTAFSHSMLPHEAARQAPPAH